jgi:hypothetical protein
MRYEAVITTEVRKAIGAQCRAMTGDWADTGFPLGCGPCSASPEVQQQWQWTQLHSMGCTEGYYADPPLTSSKIADRSISKLSRNFDFKIRAESNSVADRLKHVEYVAELLRVLHSTSCGCNLYRARAWLPKGSQVVSRV